jgi:hypothetical protein
MGDRPRLLELWGEVGEPGCRIPPKPAACRRAGRPGRVVIGWLRDFDTPTIGTLISLVLRSRAAERGRTVAELAPDPEPIHER